MSRVEKQHLKQLCTKPETLTQAGAILHTAKAKTGPGTGYNLGEAAIALPAICAYLASEGIGNNDVSEKVAQAASCLAHKDFAFALSTVRTALGTASTKPQEGTPPITFESLVRDNKFGRPEFLCNCMHDVENALIASRALRGRFIPPNDITTIAIFCWTCQTLKTAKKPNRDKLLNKFGVSPADYDHVLDVIHSTCDLIAKEIAQRLELLKASRPKQRRTITTDLSSDATPASSPTKSVTRSPTKSVLKTRNQASSPTKTPSHKRKVAFSASALDEEDALDETPSKRQKFSTSSKSVGTPIGAELSAFARAMRDASPFPPTASSSKQTLDLHASGSEGEPDQDSQDPMLIQMQLLPGASAGQSSNPSTPRRPRNTHEVFQTPSEYEGTPSKRRRTSRTLSALSLYEDGEVSRQKRCRPVLLDHKQRFQRDPRVERELKLAEAAIQNMIARYGHPFEALRPSGMVASASS